MLKKILLIIVAVLLLLPLAGCLPGQPAQLDLDTLGRDLKKIDTDKDLKSNEAIKNYKSELESASAQQKDSKEKAHYLFLAAYCAERLANYQEAVNRYEELGRTRDYKPMAYFRMGEIASHISSIPEADKVALKGYSGAGGYYPQGSILVRYPALASQLPLQDWKQESLRTAANERADIYQSRAVSYQAINALVNFLGHNKSYSYALAIILIAVIVKVVTTPLTLRSFKSMREMQAIQPLLTELQQKYKGDREAIMREQMRLFKEHKINPMGGCLPMLVQMPFLIWVFRAVWAYNWHFEGAHFLWISNLAEPNNPLLILYAVSLYFSQKLTTPPSADPQQQQTQRMMALLMPVMFLIFFKAMPAAFMLYWFMQNVLTTAHQYWVLKRSPAPVFTAATETKTIKR